KVRLDRDVREVLRQQLRSTMQFAAMVLGFGVAVALKVRQTAIGGAVGMAHHQHALRLMKADRHAHLLEDEVLLEVIARRSQRLGAASHDDHVRTLDSLLAQKLAYRLADA